MGADTMDSTTDSVGAVPTLRPEEIPSEPREPQADQISRPGTAMSISEQAGMGEDSMVAFIRSCMTSILQPFGQTVDELQKYVATLSESLSSLGTDTDAHETRLSQQAALIENLRADLDRTSEQVLEARSLLDTTIKEKASLEEQLVALQPRVDQLEQQAAVASDSLKELQPKMKETRTRLARCEEGKFETDRDIAQLRASLEKTKAEFDAWEQTHAVLVQTVNSNKADFEIRLQEIQVLNRDLKEQKKTTDEFANQLENRLRNIEEKAHEADKTLKEHSEKHQMGSANTAQLQGRTDTLEKGHEDTKERLKSCEVDITDYRVLAVENKENISRVLQVVSSPDVLTNMETGIKELSIGIRQNFDSIESLNGRCQELTEEKDQARLKTEILIESLETLKTQSERVESILGLDPISKDDVSSPGSPGMVLKGGILLTDQQIASFREIFEEFDADSSGTICITELDGVMQKGGLDPPMDIVYSILESIDMDKSGDIDFDEFCALLTKMLGADGKIDKERMLQSMYDSLSYDAKTRKAVETVIQHTTELQQHKEMIVNDQNRLSDANVRIGTLQDSIETLNSEVKKLRQGLDLSQEYWKGFSRGLKETRKTVAESEEGLPSVHKLRSTLPPLSARPSTAISTSGYAPVSAGL